MLNDGGSLRHMTLGRLMQCLRQAGIFMSYSAANRLSRNILKGLVVERCGTFPPRTHDLSKLAQVAKIAPDKDQDLFLRTLTKYYIGTRYPEEVRTLADEATKELATRLLIQTKELLQWVETLPK